MHRPGLFGSVDGGTMAVLLLWGLLWWVLPVRPAADEDVVRPPSPMSMIVAWPEPLERLPLALRPDLVTLPSAVSFGAYGPVADVLYGVAPFQHRMAVPLPPPVLASAAGGDTDHQADIQAEAARAIGRSRMPALLLSPPAGTIPVSPAGQMVIYSEGLGRTRLNDGVLKGIGGLEGGRRSEAELWVDFDEGGRPSSVFLEKGTGNPVVDRELVRQLWNPASWTGASGQGTIRIR